MGGYPSEEVAQGTSAVETDYRFAPVPEAVLYAPDLSDKAVRIYGVLMRHGLQPTECYPSHRRIAELVGCARRSVQRPLVELEEAGWITRVPRFNAAGERSSDGFIVRVEGGNIQRAPRAPQRVPPAQENADPPRTSARTGEREPLNENQRTNTDLARTAPAPDEEQRLAAFEQWWQLYPRKTAKGQARKAWPAAIRKVPVAKLLDAARRYRDDPNREDRFTAHASTWLNGERWDDPPLPSRTGRTAQPDMPRDMPTGRLDV